MNTQQRVILVGLVACLLAGPGLTQESTSCPAIVSDSLAMVASLCGETGRNQACYGNLMLTVEAQAGVDSLVFDTPGDIINVADIRSLRLTGMDEAVPEWGVALLKLQANLPDTLPGQNVTMLLIGDVAVQNAANVTGESYTPMQAFYFRSGMGDSLCAEAPESGIVIQTPKGQGQIALRVNNVDISLGSTAFLQAVAGDALYVNLLEGQATVTAFDGTQTVAAGMMVSVPIDDDLAASGPPTPPEPVAEADMQSVADLIAGLPDTVVAPTNTAETVADEVATADTMNLFGASACPYEPGRVYELVANQTYIVDTWPGCWMTTADAQAAKAEVAITVTVDGVSAGLFLGFGPVGNCAPSDGGYNFQANYVIAPLSPGMHTIQAIHNHPGGRVYSPDGSSDAWTWIETCTVHAN
ncbi:MAG: hypothetical protein H6672_14735 [Anaerolineaceae bacterium]|nr:hypothetical protein [Anaerolineaceae bacterium]